MAGASKEELTLKRLSILSLMVLLLAWSAAAQTGAQTQTNAAGSSSTNVSADKSGVKAQTDNSASASQQTDAQRSGDRKGKKAKTDAAANAGASGSAAAGPDDASAAVGTTLNAVLTKSVDSRKAKEGDEVTAKTTSTTEAPGQRTIPKGTKLIGHITKANARAKGDSESALGIVFDRAEVGKGREIPVHAVVQALAAAKTTTPGMADDSMAGGLSSAPPPGGSPSGGSSGGGLVGGAVNGVGNTASGTAGTAANTTGQVAGSAVGSATGAVNHTAASVGATANSTLGANSQGIIGLPGYTLDAAAANATQGSVITSSGKNVKLDSGTQMVLRVVSQ